MVAKCCHLGPLPAMVVHTLEVKVGCIFMLLRNIDPRNSLFNGTQIFVVVLYWNIIVTEVFSGSHLGNLVLIPKIIWRPLYAQLPFQFCCVQLPERLAYSMTNNKVQGQTFQKVGLEIPKPVFAHGKLYVPTTDQDVMVKLQETEEQAFQNG